jgi:prepilin-type N-terminal cleavage/methylation domain-containing protein
MRRSDSARTASNPLVGRSTFQRLVPRIARAEGKDGLTALEVLVVMIITAILLAVAIASYLEFHGDRLQ